MWSLFDNAKLYVCVRERKRECVCVGNLNGSWWLVSPGSGEVRTNTSCYSWTNQVYVRICPPLSALITIWMLHNISAWKCKFLSEWKSTEGPRVKKRNKKSSLPCVSSYRIEPPKPPFLNNTSAICKPDTHGSTPMSSRAAWQPKHTRVHIWALTHLQTQTHTINIPPRLYHHRSAGLIRVTKHTSFPVTPCQHS